MSIIFEHWSESSESPASYGLTAAQADVTAFHRKFGRAVGVTPGDNFDSPPQREHRAALVLEEALELIEALGFRADGDVLVPQTRPDLVEVADAVADLIYVALGAADTFGIDMSPIWAEVHATNMAKVSGPKQDSSTGKLAKVVKPPGWKPPDVEGLLKAQGWIP